MMSKVKYIAKLLLVLFSPVILVVVARVMHTVCTWVLAGIVSTEEARYSALVLTVVSFVAAGSYALWGWMNMYNRGERMIKSIIRYTAMVVTAVLLPIVIYTVAISLYRFYLFIAGMVSAEHKELLAFCSMVVLAIGLTRHIATVYIEHDTKR